jgi:hypothetical protein
MRWHLKTSIGVFEIADSPTKTGYFILRLNGESVYDGYRTIKEPVDDVHFHTTLHAPWNVLDSESVTDNLDGWTKGRYRL